MTAFLDGPAETLTDDGRRRLVRHADQPECEIMAGNGPVAVRAPRARGRAGPATDRIRFGSAVLPPYARRSKSPEVMIPILCLKGVSTGNFQEAIAALLGPDAGGPSASAIAHPSPAPST